MCELTFEKYGLILKEKDSTGEIWVRDFAEVTIELFNTDNVISIDSISKRIGNRSTYAERYICNSQDELNFLIMNGLRIGYLFK